MRVALVASGGFDRSGRERIIPSLLWLVERLARRHEVFVYVLRYHDAPCSYPLAGATIRDLGRPRGWWEQWRALARAVRADGPFDVLHGYWAQPAGRSVAPLAWRLGIPSVVTLDSGEFASLPQIHYGLQSSLRNRLAVHAAARLATEVTVCSEFQATLARARGLDPVVIPLGVDTHVFTARADVPSGQPFRLLHVASQNPVKDQATLLRAVRQVSDRGVDVTLDVVGEDTMRGHLRQLAADLSLTDRVRFHGFLPSDAIVQLYHAAHLFVLTSLHEAAGVVLLEAAACGVPIVGSRVGYLADWAPAGATAVPAANAAMLADAIATLLADPQRCRATAAVAGQWARAHDADWTAHRIDLLYQELVRRRTALPAPR